MTLLYAMLCFFTVLVPPAYAASPDEKTFQKDMAYYHKTSKAKKLGANDRLYILDRFREKYRDAEYDLSDLFAEIDKWTTAREKEAAAPKKAPAPKAKPDEGRLTGAAVTESPNSFNLVLEVAGASQFKGDLKREDEGQPPVILIYLFNTREMLPAQSKNFALKTGPIRQVQSKTISKNPLTTKVTVSLREDRPYQISREGERVILAVDKRPVAVSTPAAVPEPVAVSTPAAAPEPAPPPPLKEASTNFVYVMGGVKSQGRYEITEGTKLMQAIYMAGGFDTQARPDKVRIVRTISGKKYTQEIDTEEVIRKHPENDIVLKSGDMVLVPERGGIKQKRSRPSNTVISWTTFLVSLGLVLALLI